MKHLFISYSRNDQAIVANLANDLAGLGHQAWYDKDVTGGHAWWDSILGQIRECDVFLFILSPHGLKSKACVSELDYARALRKPLLPLLVSDQISANLLPEPLASIQYVDFRTGDRSAFVRLVRTLQELPPPAALPDPLPDLPEVPLSYLNRLANQVDSEHPLTFEQQTALVTKLKEAVHDPESRRDAIEMLQRLRRRHDLLAVVVPDIDALLQEASKPGVIPAGREARPSPAPNAPPALSSRDQAKAPQRLGLAPAKTRNPWKWAAATAVILLLISAGLLLLVLGYLGSNAEHSSQGGIMPQAPVVSGAGVDGPVPKASPNIAGNWRSPTGAAWVIHQTGTLIQIEEFTQGMQTGAGTGTFEGSSLNFTYRGPLLNSGRGYLTLSPDGLRLTGTLVDDSTQFRLPVQFFR